MIRGENLHDIFPPSGRWGELYEWLPSMNAEDIHKIQIFVLKKFNDNGDTLSQQKLNHFRFVTHWAQPLMAFVALFLLVIWTACISFKNTKLRKELNKRTRSGKMHRAIEEEENYEENATINRNEEADLTFEKEEENNCIRRYSEYSLNSILDESDELNISCNDIYITTDPASIENPELHAMAGMLNCEYADTNIQHNMFLSNKLNKQNVIINDVYSADHVSFPYNNNNNNNNTCGYNENIQEEEEEEEEDFIYRKKHSVDREEIAGVEYEECNDCILKYESNNNNINSVPSGRHTSQTNRHAHLNIYEVNMQKNLKDAYNCNDKYVEGNFDEHGEEYDYYITSHDNAATL